MHLGAPNALKFPLLQNPQQLRLQRLRQFAHAHTAIVVKPIDGHGGRGVLVVRPDDENAESILDSVTHRGTVPVVFKLLSPAKRPLQVTSDLASFWNNAYKEVRKDMRGRYPRHYWPEML